MSKVACDPESFGDFNNWVDSDSMFMFIKYCVCFLAAVLIALIAINIIFW